VEFKLIFTPTHSEHTWIEDNTCASKEGLNWNIGMIAAVNYPCSQTSVHIFTFCSQTSNLEDQHTGVHNRCTKIWHYKNTLESN